MGAYDQLVKWDEETRIPQMDLEQIKSMLCPLSNHDPLKCVGCKSVSGCPAGQRANVLLEEATARKLLSEGVDPKSAWRSAKAIENCKAAMKADDPIQFVMDKYGINRKAARERFRVWKNTYPEVVGDFDWREKSGVRGIPKKNDDISNLEKAIRSGNVYLWYRENCRIPKQRVDKIIENGFKRNPDLKELYEKMQQPKDDEVSIEEFLQELPENEKKTAVEPTTEIKTEESITEETQPVITAKNDAFGKTVVEIELEHKYQQIVAEKKKVEERIIELEERLKWLDSQQEALAIVKNLFDPNTAIGKSLSME